MVVNCGINGGGRIGRLVLRAWLKKGGSKTGLNFVLINDPFTDIENFAYLLRYDTCHGKLAYTVSVNKEAKTITVDGNTIKMTFERDPSQIPWGKHNVHTVLESSGVILLLFSNLGIPHSR